MAQKLDPAELVEFKELLMANIRPVTGGLTVAKRQSPPDAQQLIRGKAGELVVERLFWYICASTKE